MRILITEPEVLVQNLSAGGSSLKFYKLLLIILDESFRTNATRLSSALLFPSIVKFVKFVTYFVTYFVTLSFES